MKVKVQWIGPTPMLRMLDDLAKNPNAMDTLLKKYIIVK
jgi:hypothetical protein